MSSQSLSLRNFTSPFATSNELLLNFVFDGLRPLLSLSSATHLLIGIIFCFLNLFFFLFLGYLLIYSRCLSNTLFQNIVGVIVDARIRPINANVFWIRIVEAGILNELLVHLLLIERGLNSHIQIFIIEWLGSSFLLFNRSLTIFFSFTWTSSSREHATLNICSWLADPENLLAITVIFIKVVKEDCYRADQKGTDDD